MLVFKIYEIYAIYEILNQVTTVNISSCTEASINLYDHKT